MPFFLVRHIAALILWHMSAYLSVSEVEMYGREKEVFVRYVVAVVLWHWPDYD